MPCLVLHAERQKDRQTDRQTERKTDRKKERKADTQFYVYANFGFMQFIFHNFLFFFKKYHSTTETPFKAIIYFSHTHAHTHTHTGMYILHTINHDFNNLD
jgi:hypothetical protein